VTMSSTFSFWTMTDCTKYGEGRPRLSAISASG
jgi:hypothetical protein